MPTLPHPERLAFFGNLRSDATAAHVTGMNMTMVGPAITSAVWYRPAAPTLPMAA